MLDLPTLRAWADQAVATLCGPDAVSPETTREVQAIFDDVRSAIERRSHRGGGVVKDEGEGVVAAGASMESQAEPEVAPSLPTHGALAPFAYEGSACVYDSVATALGGAL